jgi:hypothetical protein
MVLQNVGIDLQNHMASKPKITPTLNLTLLLIYISQSYIDYISYTFLQSKLFTEKSASEARQSTNQPLNQSVKRKAGCLKIICPRRTDRIALIAHVISRYRSREIESS